MVYLTRKKEDMENFNGFTVWVDEGGNKHDLCVTDKLLNSQTLQNNEAGEALFVRIYADILDRMMDMPNYIYKMKDQDLIYARYMFRKLCGNGDVLFFSDKMPFTGNPLESVKKMLKKAQIEYKEMD